MAHRRILLGERSPFQPLPLVPEREREELSLTWYFADDEAAQRRGCGPHAPQIQA